MNCEEADIAFLSKPTSSTISWTIEDLVCLNTELFDLLVTRAKRLSNASRRWH